jgi:hypothetical protein
MSLFRLGTSIASCGDEADRQPTFYRRILTIDVCGPSNSGALAVPLTDT